MKGLPPFTLRAKSCPSAMADETKAEDPDPALLRHQHVEKAGIVVEGYEIQLLVKVAHVDRVHQADIVCRDKMPRTRLAQHVQLFLLERNVGIRLVAIVVESQSGFGSPPDGSGTGIWPKSV